MKVAYILTAIAQVASAHYFFDTNIINGVAQTPGKYVRTSTRATKYNPIKFSSNPAADIRDNSFVDGPDIRCNQGAFSSAGKTEVLTVTAGSEVRFRLGVGATMAHPGPSLMYMSRAPSDNVKAYDGSGDWFKIFQEGVCDTAADFTSKAWCSWERNWIAATIPKNTPSGEYLVRVEHIGVHRSHVNQPEHFTSCMQVKVTGGGNGVPGPLVKFPGAYKNTDPYANFSVYNGLKAFPFPGPAVWNGTGSSIQVPTTKSAASSPQPTTTKSTVISIQPTTTMSTIIIVQPTTTKSTVISFQPTTTMSTIIIVQPTTTPSSAAVNPKTTSSKCAASAPSGVPLYGQCGGIGYTGPIACAKGKCIAANKWYRQCV